ncbi:MAG: metal ABC transporter solute-binding protein, Zn/Mn family [Planctomycetota bacterium]|jgi:zinc transport system substrate-binding protein
MAPRASTSTARRRSRRGSIRRWRSSRHGRSGTPSRRGGRRSRRASAFSARWPALAPGFERGFEDLQLDLKGLDTDISAIVSGKTGRPMVVSHPVYQYLTRHYGLNVVSVHWEPDEVPDEAMWRELKEILEDHPARFMIWEGAPLEESVEGLTALGIQSVVFSPCGSAPESGDYLSTMRANVARLDLVFAD